MTSISIFSPQFLEKLHFNDETGRDGKPRYNQGIPQDGSQLGRVSDWLESWENALLSEYVCDQQYIYTIYMLHLSLSQSKHYEFGVTVY